MRRNYNQRDTRLINKELHRLAEFLLHLSDMQEGNAQKPTFGITLQGVSSDQNEMEAIKPERNSSIY